MKKITIDQVFAWDPCRRYTRGLVKQLFAGREALSAADILDLYIPATDKLWAVLREDMLPAEILHEYACRVAEQALLQERKAGREPDPRSWAAIEAKRKWLRGEIGDGELKAAADEAWAIADAVAAAANWAVAVAYAAAAAAATGDAAKSATAVSAATVGHVSHVNTDARVDILKKMLI